MWILWFHCLTIHSVLFVRSCHLPKPFTLYIFTCSPCRMLAFAFTQRLLKSIIRLLQWYSMNFKQHNHYIWPETSINVNTMTPKQCKGSNHSLGHPPHFASNVSRGQILSSQSRPPSHIEWWNLLKEHKTWQDNMRWDAGESARFCGERLGVTTAEVRVSPCCLVLRQSTLKCWKSHPRVGGAAKSRTKRREMEKQDTDLDI